VTNARGVLQQAVSGRAEHRRARGEVVVRDVAWYVSSNSSVPEILSFTAGAPQPLGGARGMVVRREPPEDELADLGRRLAENLPGGEGYAQTMRDETRRTADELRANPSQIPAALASTCDLELNARDVYGDGDQSPLEDSLDASNPRNAQRLRDVWCTGGDLNQLLATGRVIAFFRYCFAGDAKLVGDFIAAARADSDPDALRNLLERRESQMHVSPLFAVVAGARMRVIFDDQVVDRGTTSSARVSSSPRAPT